MYINSECLCSILLFLKMRFCLFSTISVIHYSYLSYIANVLKTYLFQNVTKNVYSFVEKLEGGGVLERNLSFIIDFFLL